MMTLKKIIDNILNWIFPISCVQCDREDEWLCQNCQSKIELWTGTAPLPDGLDKIYCATIFKPPIRELIHAYKYNYARIIAPTLADLLIRYVSTLNTLPRDPLLIPVPLHKKRLHDRGFNQSELLACHLSRKFNWDINTSLLVRKIKTKQQAKLNRKERLDNLHDAFEIISDKDLSGRDLIIIDDVMTTGSTLSACAKTLRQANPASITAVCVAYDEIKTS